MDLLEQQTVLEAERRALIDQLRQDQDIVPHRAGRRSDGSPARHRRLRRLERALVRIAAGSFGVCIECGGAISPERLEVNPSAVLCVSCKGEG